MDKILNLSVEKRFENFVNLPLDKQNTIIDASLESFGTNGYKKASISDIAATAGISKSMVFHYFGTKKNLYLYLIELCGNTLINEINKKFDSSITDFFERVKLATNIKVSVMKKHPAILSFLNSMYFETDEGVKADIKTILAKGEKIRSKIGFDGMDVSKFKNSVDSKLVMKMLVLVGEGFVSESTNRTGYDIDVLCQDFEECMNLLKSNFYKKKYL